MHRSVSDIYNSEIYNSDIYNSDIYSSDIYNSDIQERLRTSALLLFGVKNCLSDCRNIDRYGFLCIRRIAMHNYYG